MRFLPPARFLLPLSLLLASGAGAQPSGPTETLPLENSRQARHLWVSDRAEVLSASEKRRINAVCDALEQRTGSQLAVVTVRNLGGKDVKSYANDLYRDLGIGRKGQDDGVLILATVEDRKIWIETGYGLEGALPDSKASEIWKTQIAPPLSRKEYGAGLYAGALSVAQAVDPNFVAPKESLPASPTTSPNPVERRAPPENFDYPATDAPTRSPSRSPSSGGALFGLLGFLVLLFPLFFIGGIVWFFTAAMRRPLRCSKCRAPVQQLSETAELPSLSPVQQFEQRIGARDYRVWRCDKCHNQDITAHDLPYSQWVQCPTCRHQTASTLVETTREPTPWQGGMERVILSCQWLDCKHASFYNRPTAPLSRGSYRRGSGGATYGGGGDLLTGVILGSLLNGSLGGNNSVGGGWSGGSSGDSFGGDSGSFDSGPSDFGSGFGGGDSGGGGAGGDY